MPEVQPDTDLGHFPSSHWAVHQINQWDAPIVKTEATAEAGAPGTLYRFIGHD